MKLEFSEYDNKVLAQTVMDLTDAIEGIEFYGNNYTENSENYNKKISIIKAFECARENNNLNLNERFDYKEVDNKYIILMTPRSGSTMICDLIEKTKVMGSPGEFLYYDSFIETLNNFPSNDVAEFLDFLLRFNSIEGLSGLKSDYYSFNIMLNSSNLATVLGEYKYIVLTRKDRIKQAVSLYVAEERNVFHSKEIDLDDNKKIKYNFDRINYYHKSILIQEIGIKKIIEKYNLGYIKIDYESIVDDSHAVLNYIYRYLTGLDLKKKNTISEYKKLSKSINEELIAAYKVDLL